MISKHKKERGLQFARAVSELAARAPDDELKAKTYAVANAARLQYGYKWPEKKAEVVRCVSLGASTREDLLRETPFPRQELDQILKELVDDKTLRVTHAQLNRVGPKVAQYFPNDM